MYYSKIKRPILIQRNISTWDLKSVNLQYNTMGCLEDGTNELSTKSLMFQVSFFNTFYRFRALKTQKNNTWNIRCLVDDSKVNGWFICPIVQATQRIIFWIDEILYIMTLGDAAVDKRNGVKETSAEKLDSTMHLSKRIENPESQQNWHSVQS